MPLNHRQERFCRFFVHYGAAGTAAAEAGYARPSAHKQGWRLLRVPAIRRRIREIQAEIAEHHDLAERTAVGKLQVVYERALEDHQFSAAARAAELQFRIVHHRGAAPVPAADGAECVSTGPKSPARPQTSAAEIAGVPRLRSAG
ncbi:MAG: terminase small subunit [Magnetovibrio sp.]|nr:terminase small subunit [Magnetovibrio sp.]